MKISAILVLVLTVFFLSSCDTLKPGPILISQPLIILQNITGIMAVVLAITELVWMVRVAEFGWWKSLYALGTLAYALHVCAYYIIVAGVRLDIVHITNVNVFLTDWSSVLRFHDVGLLLSIGGQRLRSMPKQNGVKHDLG